MWGIAGWIALGAVLMTVVLFSLGRWEMRRAEREKVRKWEEREERAEKDRRMDFEYRTSAAVSEIHRRLSLTDGNVEYLQTQNAGQARTIEKLEAQAEELLRRLP